MVKIKRKVKMTLSELIDWGFKNNITNKEFFSNLFEKKSVKFNLSGYIKFSDSYVYLPEDTFTVEIEEEITEDTKIQRLSQYTTYGFRTTKLNSSIKEEKDEESLAFYIMNDDREMTLIWTKEKGLMGE